MTGGIIAITLKPATCSQATVSDITRLGITTVRGVTLVREKTKAMRNSFQGRMKEKNATGINPDLNKGRIM